MRRTRTAADLRAVGRTLLGRALEAAAVVGALATLVFLALRLLPGDPAALVLGDMAGEAERAALRRKLHLDEPMALQYARFLYGLATLDLGDSIRRPGVPAVRRVLEVLPDTGALSGVAVLLGAIAGVALGTAGAGPWLGERRRLVQRAATACAATPLLAFAPLLTYTFAARLQVVPLPGDPEAGIFGLLFAAGLLAVPLAAHVARISGAALRDLDRAWFLVVARAKGASLLRVYVVHALPAAAGPIVTVVGTQLGALLGGAVVLERLFERPGLGSLILEAYATRDVPVLEAAVVVSGALFVGCAELASGAHSALDPRARSPR